MPDIEPDGPICDRPTCVAEGDCGCDDGGSLVPVIEPSGGTPATGLCICRGSVPTVQAYHDLDCPVATAYDKHLFARAMLADPALASVEMSGMSSADLRELRRAFG